MNGVRWRVEGFEGQCNACLEWLPLETEFWSPKFGLSKCRTCHQEIDRQRAAAERADPVRGKELRVYSRDMKRVYYHADPEKFREKGRENYAKHKPRAAAYRKAHYAANREQELAKSREYRVANRARIAEGRRRYYIAHRDEILAKKRERDARRKEAAA